MKPSSRKILCLGLAAYVACTGQGASETKTATQESPPTVVAIGEPVPELDNGIPVIFQDQRGTYWFAGGKRGVVSYDGKNLSLYTKADGLASHAVIGIQEDASGNLYFDTLAGVSKFDGRKFTTLAVQEGHADAHEWKLAPGDLWFSMGRDKSGPFRFDGEVLHYLPLPKTEREDAFKAANPNASFNPYGIYRIYKDSKGAVWFGTASLGLCRYDGASLRWLYEEHLTQTPTGGDFGIRTIIEDKEGKFWFSNPRYRYEMLTDQPGGPASQRLHYRRDAGLAYMTEDHRQNYPYFLSVAKDERGDLWMATYDDGVYRQVGEKLVHYPVRHGAEDIHLFAIYKDRQGGLWLGTHEAGVYRFNGSAFEPFKP